MGKKVAIIGAGTSGLLACKYTLSKGFQPIVFESASTIGGVWTKIIETIKLQTPREAYRFSDFPWPSSVTEDFPNQHQVLDYIQSYAHHFDLLKHIKFNTKVCGIEYEGSSEDEMQAWSLWGGSGEPFSSKGKWKVVVEDKQSLSTEYKYGPIFQTSLARRQVVIIADPEFNNYIFQQEERMVELWYLDMFSKIFVHEGESKTNAVGMVHKYVRSIFLNHFGAERLKEKLLPQIEEFVNKSLCAWSSKASVEVEHAGSMVFNFSAKQMISYDAEKSSDDLSEKYTKIIDGLMSFPLNIPGTAYYNCSKHQKNVTTMLRDMLKERRISPETRRGDFLDQINVDMEKEKFLSEDFSVQLVFGGLFATFEFISAVLALAFCLLAEHPSVVQELPAEHEAIFKNRENPNSSLTWDEYKSMTFTLQVINEILRLGNVAPGLLRRALKDIPVKGFTIPEGWTIMVVTSALQLSPNTFEDPLEFNPWRWKDLDSYAVSKNFMPFGGGMRQCAGAEYSRVFLATFLHVLVTKYRWTTIKAARIARNPILGFGDGIHIKFEEKKT